jgi:cytidylate kinase
MPLQERLHLRECMDGERREVEEPAMQVICISRGTLGGGRELAERLAKNLGCTCLSRERLIEAATNEGIQVGKLEMATMKPHIFGERLAVEREYYRAFLTAYLCEQAAEGQIVYHGRMGHMLLPGIDHVLSVRVVADYEQRIWRAVRDLRLDAVKARKYIAEVDEDRERWARFMYGVGCEDPDHFDVVINLHHMSVQNAASAITAVTQLPDFQVTPASQKAMEDQRLAAQSRVALARHERTSRSTFKVVADAGVVTVTYLPQDSRYAKFIPEALGPVGDISEIRTTMAATGILWIQERFDSTSEQFHDVAELATKWNAAVEILSLTPRDQDEESAVAPTGSFDVSEAGSAGQSDGGVEDDVEEVPSDDRGVKVTLGALAAAGCSGGGKTIRGAGQEVVESLGPSPSYSVVVVGDLFLDRNRAARVRMTREFQRFVGEHITAPVVGADDLKRRYLFGRRDVAKLAVFLVVVGALYFVVFSNQEVILRFASGQGGAGGFWAKILVAAAVVVFVPIVAQCYGTVAKSLMKLVKME